jgi:hypothetical protein
MSVWAGSGLITRIAISEPEDADAAVERLRAFAP